MAHRTVLARKGPLRRAEAARPCALRAVLSGWFRDGRLRRDELRSFFSTTEHPKANRAANRLHGFAQPDFPQFADELGRPKALRCFRVYESVLDEESGIEFSKRRTLVRAYIHCRYS